MPVQPTQAYYNGISEIQKANIDWVNDTIEAMLLLDGYTVTLSQSFVQELVGTECADPDYLAAGTNGRIPLTGKTSTLNTDQHEFSSAKVSWGSNVSITARYLVIYKRVTNDTDSPLIFVIDLTGSGNESSDAAEFSYTPSASGYYFVDINETAA